MIEQDRADRRKSPKIIFVGSIVAVPGNNVQRRLADISGVKIAIATDASRVWNRPMLRWFLQGHDEVPIIRSE
jgi:hypothetical protein